VTKAAFADLVRAIPGVHEVVEVAPELRAGQLRRRLAAYGRVAVVDLHGKLRSCLVRGLAPRPWRVAWSKRPWRQTLALKVCGRPYRATQHIAARYHTAVEKLVGRSLARQPLAYRVAAEDLASADATLSAHGVVDGRPLVGVSPGAMWETKRWPVERFTAIAERLTAAGYQVVLTGSPQEAAVTRSVRRAVAPAIDLGGELRFGTLGAVISRCTAFVANDSGPMHISRALGVPTLALFGSTDPGQFDFTGHALQYAGLSCSACSFHGLRRCPRGHLRCLLDLSVEQAWDALRVLVGSGPVPPVFG
jgi:heptosyltransferase-2